MVFQNFPYEYSYLLLPLIGFFIAFVGTMIGGGGGFFFFPILTLFYHVPAQTAVATSLLATIPICFTGAVAYYRKGELSFKVGGWLSLVGVIGGVLGVFLMKNFHSSTLKQAFGVYSVLMGTYLFIKARSGPLHHGQHHRLGKRQIAGNSGLGLSAGIITGCFGTSGSAPILTALFNLNLPLKKVVGTSLLIVLVNTIGAATIHLAVTDLSKPILLFITLGSIPGAFLGPMIFSNRKIKTKNKTVKYIYAAMICTIGVCMILN